MEQDSVLARKPVSTLSRMRTVPTVPRRLPGDVVDQVRREKIIGVRAGVAPHRIIGIWGVVVEGRVFVRSWSLKPRSWYRTFLEDPRGVLAIGGQEMEVRAVNTRSER